MSDDMGAFTPATIMPPGQPKFTLVAPAPSTESTNRGSGTGRKGRPPGSKNRPKGDQEVMTGSGVKTRDEIDKEANKKAEKKAKAEEYAKYISEDVNDKIFIAIVMLSGGKIDPEAFYLPGKAPEFKKSDPRLSELGKTVAIPPDMANSWGKLLAELSYTDAGKTATKYAGTSNLAIVGAALTALLTTFQYALTIKPVVEGIKLMQQQANDESEEE